MNEIAKFGRQKKREFLFKQENSHAWLFQASIPIFQQFLSFRTAKSDTHNQLYYDTGGHIMNEFLSDNKVVKLT